MIIRKWGALAATTLLLASLACGTDAPGAGSAQPQPPPTAPAETAEVIRVPTVDPNDQTIRSHLATKVLETGTQRVAFLLNTNKALIDAPQVRIELLHGNEPDPHAEVIADYNPWPFGVRGSYAAPVDFPEPGDYSLRVTPLGGDVSGEAVIEVSVAEDSPVPSVGEKPPATVTKTLGDGTDITNLSTAYEPDPGLYELSLDEAIASGQPTVVVFATPAFCTSPTCGPQVDTVSELRAAHPDAGNYIHVELYDNPAEIQGDLSRAALVPAADEWGFTQLPDWTNESWVFVLDSDGIVRQRFEGFATLTELEQALNAASN